MKKEWWSEGVRFECQGSGRCCVSRGEFGYVYLTKDERKNMAKLLKMRTSAFTRKYCRNTGGAWHLMDGKGPECIFLENGNRCSVYEARPGQCRTWPFWPEVMNAKSWKKEVAAYCPGVGKGPIRSANEITRTLEELKTWENDIAHGR